MELVLSLHKENRLCLRSAISRLRLWLWRGRAGALVDTLPSRHRVLAEAFHNIEEHRSQAVRRFRSLRLGLVGRQIIMLRHLNPADRA